MSDDRQEMFRQRYAQNETPWDTGITPPELVRIVAELPVGRALDLGCGTGTNLRYLLERGWQADGVDFIAQAVTEAQVKLADMDAGRFAVYCHDVTQLPALGLPRTPYDLVVDIGCGHGLPIEQASAYARDIAALLRAGGTWLLYAHQPSPERGFGWTPDDVAAISAPHFDLAAQSLNTDNAVGNPAGWYRLTRRP
jgi:SAM-dependent methyltransferase